MMILPRQIIFTTVFILSMRSIQSDEMLSELPMGKLIALRKSFVSDLRKYNTSYQPLAESLVRPKFNILEHMQQKTSIDRGHYEDYEEDEGEEEWWPMMKMKGKGVEAVFDGTVTALSFLAFGGYLLCLIVQSIREKNNNNNNVATTTNGGLVGFVPSNQAFPVQRPVLAIRPGRKRRHTEMAYGNYTTTVNNSIYDDVINLGYYLSEMYVLQSTLKRD